MLRPLIPDFDTFTLERMPAIRQFREDRLAELAIERAMKTKLPKKGKKTSVKKKKKVKVTPEMQQMLKGLDPKAAEFFKQSMGL